MHPPRSNSAYQANQLGDNQGEGADQSAANQIEGRYALSWADNIWADMLG